MQSPFRPTFCRHLFVGWFLVVVVVIQVVVAVVIVVVLVVFVDVVVVSVSSSVKVSCAVVVVVIVVSPHRHEQHIHLNTLSVVHPTILMPLRCCPVSIWALRRQWLTACGAYLRFCKQSRMFCDMPHLVIVD